MTPEAFIAKWRDVQTKERAAAQEHFIDLCRLLDEPTPNQADPKGDWYAFEKGATRTGAGRGWADVWKRGHFGWEYKVGLTQEPQRRLHRIPEHKGCRLQPARRNACCSRCLQGMRGAQASQACFSGEG